MYPWTPRNHASRSLCRRRTVRVETEDHIMAGQQHPWSAEEAVHYREPAQLLRTYILGNLDGD